MSQVTDYVTSNIYGMKIYNVVNDDNYYIVISSCSYFSLLNYSSSTKTYRQVFRFNPIDFQID